MTYLSEAEQHNYDWLTSVMKDGSGYTRIFKQNAQFTRIKFQKKMKA
jgi:hypothetical protein